MTLDERGAPWIAATMPTSAGQQVIAATPDGDAWAVQTVAELPACTDCDVPARTGIAATPDGPVVVYADPAGGVTAARPDGRRWTTEVVDAGADGTGLAVAADTDGALTASYYDSSGIRQRRHVRRGELARGRRGRRRGSGEGSAEGLSTGVAVSDDGRVFLTYVDPGEDAVMVATSADGGPFEPVETPGTEGGRWPDVAATPDGATVSLVWYAPKNEDLAFGTVTETSEVQVAAPSPPFAVGTLARGRRRGLRSRHGRRPHGSAGDGAGGRHGRRVRGDLPRGPRRRGAHPHVRQPGRRAVAQRGVLPRRHQR